MLHNLNKEHETYLNRIYIAGEKLKNIMKATKYLFSLFQALNNNHIGITNNNIIKIKPILSILMAMSLITII
jgi:hypothetical protein